MHFDVYLPVFVAKSFITVRCYLERYLQNILYPYSEKLMSDLLKLKLILYRCLIFFLSFFSTA